MAGLTSEVEDVEVRILGKAVALYVSFSHRGHIQNNQQRLRAVR